MKQVCHTTGIIFLSSFLKAASSKFSVTFRSTASAVVKALASYKCDLGFCLNATLYVVWMGLLLVLAHAGVLYPGAQVFTSPRKTNMLRQISIPGIKWVRNY